MSVIKGRLPLRPGDVATPAAIAGLVGQDVTIRRGDVEVESKVLAAEAAEDNLGGVMVTMEVPEEWLGPIADLIAPPPSRSRCW